MKFYRPCKEKQFGFMNEFYAEFYLKLLYQKSKANQEFQIPMRMNCHSLLLSK